MSQFIITHLSNNTLPYNTTMPSNPLYFLNIIFVNMPWFFPLITMFLFLIGEYIITIKQPAQSKTGTMALALAYTMLSYVEVSGGLTNTGYFIFFEFITMILMFLITLFVNPGET